MSRGYEWVGIEHEGIMRDAPKEDDAVLFDCQDKEVWIPRSLLKDYDDATLIVRRWKADDLGLEPDWEL